jgi:hypothetical protein
MEKINICSFPHTFAWLRSYVLPIKVKIVAIGFVNASVSNRIAHTILLKHQKATCSPPDHWTQVSSLLMVLFRPSSSTKPSRD